MTYTKGYGMAESLTTGYPIGEPVRTWIGDPPYDPYRIGDFPHTPGWQTPQPIPYTPYPLTWPTTTTGGTTSLDLLNTKKVKRLEDLLSLIHDELLGSDDEDHLALAELIEETLGL